MVLDLDLTAAKAKVERAQEHLGTLNRELPEEWEENGPYSIRFSAVDPLTGWCNVYIVPRADAKPRWGIIFGDVMHNLRSALDYIVTALVDASRTRLLTQHQFPIYTDPGLYAKCVEKGRRAPRDGPLAGVKVGRELIEQLQPYHHQLGAEEDFLYHVWRFSNADKHRQVTRTLAIPIGTLDIKCNGVVVDHRHITEIPDWKPDEEALIHSLRFDPPMAYNLRAVPPLRIIAGFSTPKFGPLPEHAILANLLPKVCDYVWAVVEQFQAL